MSRHSGERRRDSVSSTRSSSTAPGIGIQMIDSPAEVPLLAKAVAPGSYGAYSNDVTSEKGKRKHSRTRKASLVPDIATPVLIGNERSNLVNGSRRKHRPSVLYTLGCFATLLLSLFAAVALTVLIYILAAFFSNIGMREWDVFGIHNDDGKEYDAAVVLGFVLDGQDSIQPELEARLQTVLDLYLSGRIVGEIILSGGKPSTSHEKAEAEVMGEWLEVRGVPSSRLVQEGQSRTTAENAKYSIPILVNSSYKRVVIVTNTFHQYRSFWLFHGQCDGAAFCQARFRMADARKLEGSISRSRHQYDFFREILAMGLAILKGNVSFW
ncbi:DUF218 domain [Carpediemonas membranifera]|uniref:DUF218 domain n=1 Tax=Carpediemonas membranifera TaxID=201153 RepID=A0A8J6B7W3_9EUKA|nr:DUF218 domain [Carpediemonas membranifera]|eukprot:KAG9391857.1 DUF218 domain [Carpediemonas membranifera]